MQLRRTQRVEGHDGTVCERTLLLEKKKKKKRAEGPLYIYKRWNQLSFGGRGTFGWGWIFFIIQP